jgi:CheY-like chemotaxis protein
MVPPGDHNRHTILLVDDDPDSLEVHRQILEWFGWSVETATNGPDALIAARRDKPDAILLDLAMPGMDGGAVLAALRRDDGTKAIPVIALTGVPEWLEDRRDLAYPFDDVVFKPVPNDMLVRRILGAMTRER